MRKLKLRDFDSNMFANPDLQRFYTGSHLAAGVETEYNPDGELLNPNVEEMMKRADNLLTDLKTQVAGEEFDGMAVAQILPRYEDWQAIG